MSLVQGGGREAPSFHDLYPLVHDVDDGTWRYLNTPGEHGLGIMPWLEYTPSYGDMMYLWSSHSVNNVVSTPHLVPAFVQWEAIDDSFLVRLVRWWAFDGDNDFDHEEVWTKPRSYLLNVDFDQGTWNEASGVVPAWCVTPVDPQYFYPWLEEAQESWDPRSVQNLYDEGLGFVCGYCGSELGEDHIHGCCDNRVEQIADRDEHLEACAKVVSLHSEVCDLGPYDPVTDNCVECEYDFNDDFDCTCGLEDWSERLVQTATNTADCVNRISTHMELFTDTWRYALESYYRGWNRCWELKKEGSSWFSSLWWHRSPFFRCPGPAPLVQAPLPYSTSSVTPLAS